MYYCLALTEPALPGLGYPLPPFSTLLGALISSSVTFSKTISICKVPNSTGTLSPYSVSLMTSNKTSSLKPLTSGISNMHSVYPRYPTLTPPQPLRHKVSNPLSSKPNFFYHPSCDAGALSPRIY